MRHDFFVAKYLELLLKRIVLIVGIGRENGYFVTKLEYIPRIVGASTKFVAT